jgi:hypothetical protein
MMLPRGKVCELEFAFQKGDGGCVKVLRQNFSSVAKRKYFGGWQASRAWISHFWTLPNTSTHPPGLPPRHASPSSIYPLNRDEYKGVPKILWRVQNRTACRRASGCSSHRGDAFPGILDKKDGYVRIAYANGFLSFSALLSSQSALLGLQAH